jgi:hypothetical protein
MTKYNHEIVHIHINLITSRLANGIKIERLK